MPTRSELKSDALDILGRGPGAGNPVPPEDDAIIERFIAPLFRQLAADNIVTVYDTENIPDEYYIPLVMLLANACGFKFDIPFDNTRKLELERQIRSIVASPPTHEPLKVDYF